VWRYVWKDGKWDKPPLQVNGRPAKANDPATWTDFPTAYRVYCQAGYGSFFDGIGYVPTADDPFVFLDFDRVVGPDGVGTWSPELRAIFAGDVPEPAALVEQLGSYAEVSPSGTGIRIVCKGKLPEGRRKIGGKGNGCPDGVEMYATSHYLTITGQRLPEAPAAVNDCTEKLAALHLAVFGRPDPKPPAVAPGEARPATVAVYLGDAELIDKASQAKGGEQFRRLWDGDATGYPGRSEADMALASRLAFWCGPDTGRIERLMRQSGLTRPKWDNHRSYLARTIGKALEGRTDFYSPDKMRIPCSSIAGGLRSPNSVVVEEHTIRGNWDKSTQLQPNCNPTANYHDWEKAPEMKRASSRWKSSPWDCLEARRVRGRQEFSPCMITVTCRRRTCPVCENYRKLQTFRRFGYYIFAHDGQLYTESIFDADWPATVKEMRRRAKRLGVPLRYVAIRGEDNYLTIISSIIPGEVAWPVEKADALDILEKAIDTASPDPRPVNSCRGWKPLDKPEVKRVAGDVCSPEAFQATCKAWGSNVEGGPRFLKCESPGLFSAEDGTFDTTAETDFWYEGWLRDTQGDAEADAQHDKAIEQRKRIKAPQPAPVAVATQRGLWQ
jgi:hypothetical protein